MLVKDAQDQEERKIRKSLSSEELKKRTEDQSEDSALSHFSETLFRVF